MDRATILRQLLTLSYDDDFPLGAAGDYSAVDRETEAAVLRLWFAAVEQNPWLLPEGVYRMSAEEGAAVLTAGAGYFLAGYMLARRELIEVEQDLAAVVAWP
jgi:hypothetical protein